MKTQCFLKSLFLLLMVIFLGIDFVPDHFGYVDFDKIEHTQSGDQESESDGKEVEKEDHKDYPFNNVETGNGRSLAEMDSITEEPGAFNHLYIDVFTPPPEHYDYPIC